jgi:hypothetical protein
VPSVCLKMCHVAKVAWKVLLDREIPRNLFQDRELGDVT